MISFIDIISMEIRLTILNENETECFMNGTMPIANHHSQDHII